MAKTLLLPIALVITVAAHAGHTQAQDKVETQKVQELKKQDTVPPATGRNLPEQAGAQEPSSKIQGTSKNENVFENGVLAVPGAQTDVDTAPAKFSPRTAADDRLAIADYRLKHLTADQRSEILQGLGPQRGAVSASAAGNDAYAVVGAEVPSAVALYSLTPTPNTLVQKFPELRGTAFMDAAGKMLVVDLDNSLVIGVLGG